MPAAFGSGGPGGGAPGPGGGGGVWKFIVALLFKFVIVVASTCVSPSGPV